MGHARIRGSRGWVTARGHPAKTDTSLVSNRNFEVNSQMANHTI